MVDRYSNEVIGVIKAIEGDGVPLTPTLHVALYGGMYEDPDNPSGPSLHYRGSIKSDIIFKKHIGIAFWKESSGIDFGFIDIALEDQDDNLIDWGKKVTVATVELYRVNLSSPTENQLEIIASARTSDIGFSNEHTMRLRIESVLQDGFDTAINERFYGYGDVDALIGKPYPIAWGLITDPQQVIPTVEADETILLYHVTDIEIDSFSGGGVYDRGVLLTELGGEFDQVPFGFTLNQNPSGRLTSGRVLLKDPEDTGNFFHGLFRFVRLVMTRAGIWNFANEAELTQLEADIGMGDFFPQYFTFNITSLKDFLSEVLGGVTGWYFVDELTEVHFGRMTDPDVQSGIPFNFTDSNTVGKIKVEDDKAPGLSSRLSFARNPGAYDQSELAGGVNWRVDITTTNRIVSAFPIGIELWTADDASWTADNTVHTADGFAGQLFFFSNLSYWKVALVREPIILNIAFDPTTGEAFALALAEVNRWWNELYHVRRRFYTFDTPLNEDMFETLLPQLGGFCTLQSDRFKLLGIPKNLFIRRMEFNYSKNLLTIEGWG